MQLYIHVVQICYIHNHCIFCFCFIGAICLSDDWDDPWYGYICLDFNDEYHQDMNPPSRLGWRLTPTDKWLFDISITDKNYCFFVNDIWKCTFQENNFIFWFWICRSFVPCISLTSPYLNQSWNIINLPLSNKLQWNINRNSKVLVQENGFENVGCKVMAILSQPLMC